MRYQQQIVGGYYYWRALYILVTSCSRGDTICLRLLQVDNIFAFICQMAVLVWHNNIFVFIRQVSPACWLLKISAKVDL